MTPKTVARLAVAACLCLPAVVTAGEKNQKDDGQKNQKDDGQQNQNGDGGAKVAVLRAQVGAPVRPAAGLGAAVGLAAVNAPARVGVLRAVPANGQNGDGQNGQNDDGEKNQKDDGQKNQKDDGQQNQKGQKQQK